MRPIRTSAVAAMEADFDRMLQGDTPGMRGEGTGKVVRANGVYSRGLADSSFGSSPRRLPSPAPFGASDCYAPPPRTHSPYFAAPAPARHGLPPAGSSRLPFPQADDSGFGEDVSLEDDLGGPKPPSEDVEEVGIPMEGADSPLPGDEAMLGAEGQIPEEPVATVDVLAQRKEQAQRLRTLSKNGIPLIPCSELPERWRGAFPFVCFNEVQSKVFDAAYGSDENLVVSAPTGSGKTTVFELAFIRLMQFAEECGSETTPLAIYMAPTKALCGERSRDWAQRLADPAIKCIEVTGDTTNYELVQNALKEASLIVTTPEKWDSLTRKTDSVGRLMSRLRLVMIDEVHILREDRGATLEVVVSRMKSRGEHVRFVALSASLPNIDDVARWLGQPTSAPIPTGIYEGGGVDRPSGEEDERDAFRSMPKAKVFKFGEEFRPVPLKREVYGFEANNDWALNSRLDKELYPILMKHGNGQPVLVFCPTRKMCQSTAENVCRLYQNAQRKGHGLPWAFQPNSKLNIHDSRVAELTTCGIAVHHAGLDIGDRRAIEEGFRAGKLFMLVSTSTLAVGVNLPAHTVVIKGTMTWQGPATGFREYSDIDIQQMMGRAGRPQYDTSGIVVVMCERSKQMKYRDMLNSQTILESRLHQNLTEHINSEIGLGTIVSLRTAQDWLKSSYLYIRIQQNPKHYAFTAARSKPAQKGWAEWLDHYVEVALEQLEENKLIEHDETGIPEEDEQRIGLRPTECGKIMSGQIVSFNTMKSIMRIQAMSDLRDMVEILAGATEFAELRIRPGENQLLNKLRTSPEMRWQLQEPVKTYADKVFIHLQVCWGAVDVSAYEKDLSTDSNSSHQTLMAIYQHAPRIAKAITLYTAHRKLGQAIRASLELTHIVNGKAWEDSAAIFRQIDNIGPKTIATFASMGINSFDKLLAVDTSLLEGWLKRQPQFIKKVLDQVRAMPRFKVTIEEEAMTITPGQYPVVSLRVNVHSLADATKTAAKHAKIRYNIACLTLRSDGLQVDYRTVWNKTFDKTRKDFAIDVKLEQPGQTVSVYVAADNWSGCATTVEYDPRLDVSRFPTTPPNDDEDSEDEEEDDAPPEEPPVETVPAEKSTIQEPARMPNGNLRCSHKCKHRDVCNHPCCREGIKEGGKKGGKGRGKAKVIERRNPIPASAFPTMPLTTKSLEPPQDSRDPADSPQVGEEEPLFLGISSDASDEHIDVTAMKRKKKSKNPKVNESDPAVGRATKRPAEVADKQPSGKRAKPHPSGPSWASTRPSPPLTETTKEDNIETSSRGATRPSQALEIEIDELESSDDEPVDSPPSAKSSKGVAIPSGTAGNMPRQVPNEQSWFDFDPFSDAMLGARLEDGKRVVHPSSSPRPMERDDWGAFGKKGRSSVAKGPRGRNIGGIPVVGAGATGARDGEVEESYDTSRPAITSSDDPNYGLDEDDAFLTFVKNVRKARTSG